MPYKMKSFGGVDLPRHHVGQQPNEIGTATVRDMLMPVVGGYFDTHNDGLVSGTLFKLARPAEPQTINYTAYLLGEMPRRFRDEYHALTAMVGKRGRLIRVDDLGNEQWLWAVLLGITPSRKSGDLMQELRFTFRLPTPIWRGEYKTVTHTVAGGGGAVTYAVDTVLYSAPAPAQNVLAGIGTYLTADRYIKTASIWSSNNPSLASMWDLDGLALTTTVNVDDSFNITAVGGYSWGPTATGVSHAHSRPLELSANRTFSFRYQAKTGAGADATSDAAFVLGYYEGYW